MTTRDIRAARERLESAKRELDEFVGDWTRRGRVRSGERHDKVNDLHRWLTSAVSDLLLAMTAPAEAPAKPERVAVLRHRDGWHVYSDGSDDEPGLSAGPGSWDIAPCKAGERRAWAESGDPGDRYTALIEGPPRPADERVAEVARELDPVPEVVRIPDHIAHPECRECDLDKHFCPGCGCNASHDNPVCDACNAFPASEPEVPASVRQWLDALREVWPEMRAKFDRGAHYDLVMNQSCVAFVIASGEHAYIHYAHRVEPFSFYDTPAALVAALKKSLGVPEPKPEPTRPALWEWVRAACESRLGEPRMHTLRGGALQWALPHTVIWALRDDRADGGVWHVQRDSGETIAATCSTPAELTAALNALAEEVGK